MSAEKFPEGFRWYGEVIASNGRAPAEVNWRSVAKPLK